jgi:excisionase family DNA binding protein
MPIGHNIDRPLVELCGMLGAILGLAIERLFTPAQICEILGLRRSCVYRMLRSGEIPAVRVRSGGRRLYLRVRPSALERWLREREMVRR